MIKQKQTVNYDITNIDPRCDHRELIHTNTCINGYYKENVLNIDFNNKYVLTAKDTKCDGFEVIKFCNNFKLSYLKIPKCQHYHLLHNNLMLNFKKMFVEEVFKKTIINIRNRPLWNGEKNILEEVFFSDNNTSWRYFVETKIENISNIFNNIDYDNYLGYEILESNLEYLKRCDFVSKRDSLQEISTSTVNKMINKLNKLNKLNKK